MKEIGKLLTLTIASLMTMAACSQAAATTGTVGSAKDGNEQKIETAAMKLVKAVADGGYALVNTEDLKKMVDAKEPMIIIDTMPSSSFKTNRIPGAVNAEVPVKLSDVTAEQRAALVAKFGTDKAKKIVLYCGFVSCERSHVAALIAKEEGFTNIVRHPGGIIAWVDAKYAIEKD